MNGERRGATRYDLALPVHYREGCVGVTRNISASGVYLATDQAAPVGDRFMVEVDLADTTFRCEGRVLRLEMLGGAFGIALELTTSCLEMTLTGISTQPEKELQE